MMPSINGIRKSVKTEPVFIIIGIGENPSDPDHVCLIPLDEINSIKLTESFLEKYTIANNRPIAISKLQDFIDLKKQKSEPVKAKPAKKAPVAEKSKEKSSGYCVRCGDTLSFNISKPLCRDCYTEWAEYENEDYEENFCHHCGKEKDVTFAKPVCYNCYKQLSK
jgi:ribosomal protein S14